MSRTPVIIYPPPSWWHAHLRGWVWTLCTDRFCKRPYRLEDWK